MTLWSGRMGSGPAREMMAFTSSLATDERLFMDDLRGSLAHVRGLAHAGLLDVEELIVLERALTTLAEEHTAGRFAFVDSDEDVHTAIERRVTEIAGAVGEKLHTGRSRNDQVATATRLYTRRELVQVAEALIELCQTLADRARAADVAYLPGYTHLQRAQPVLLAHHLLAHGWALLRDLDRLLDTHRRLNASPLGAGALGGSSLPLEPDGVAEELGFAARFENSIDAVSDRDFVAEVLFDLALLAVHLSRMGEDVMLYTTEEFGFYRLDDAWATGSSMLPQKKNPDIAELARGKAGGFIGRLVALLTTLKGTPSGYNRDLQEDKAPLFQALDEILLELPAVTGLYRSVEFDTKRMAEAADSGDLVALDLAEWLVVRGTPFREAHRLVGGLVRRASEDGVPLAELVTSSPAFGRESLALFEPGSATVRRRTPGGGGIDAVRIQLGRFEQRLQAGRRLVAVLVR